MEKGKKITMLTLEQLMEARDVMVRINTASEMVLSHYFTMLDFIESKGLIDECNAYFADKFHKHQEPAENGSSDPGK